MAKFRLPHGARNVQMYDGTVYRSEGNFRRGRTIDVDDAAHARKIAQMGGVEGTVHTINPSGAGLPGGRECPDCDFSAWPWQRRCPRCGATTVEIP